MENKSKGKAVERIDALLDERSFVEIGQAVTARSTDFQLDKVETPSDGVVTGYGLINGCPVYVYSQDASILGGSIGEMHARKIANLYDLAMKTGVAVIGMIDCAGINGCTSCIWRNLQETGTGIRSDLTDQCNLWKLWRGSCSLPNTDRFYIDGRKWTAVCKCPKRNHRKQKRSTKQCKCCIPE